MDKHFVERYRELWNALGISEEAIKARQLPLFEEAEALCTAEVSSGGLKFYLTPAAGDAWKTIKLAAAQDGIEITIHSAFRSVARQTQLIQNRLQSGLPIDGILTRVAPPGCSEHHTGCAIDISMGEVKSLDQDFELTPAYRWLCAHAKRFGFTLSFPRDNTSEYIYEPWHWFFSEVAGQ